LASPPNIFFISKLIIIDWSITLCDVTPESRIRNDVDVHRLYRLENANSIRVKSIFFFLFRFVPYDTMYLNSIPETMLIIYGISIERCVLCKCNVDRWSCTCFRNGVWGGELLLRYDFFLFCLNKQTNRISF
jgi:hypothetical protein